MRSLPHIAIGCASVWAGTRLLGKLSASAPSTSSQENGRWNGASHDPEIAESVDFRLVAFGSLLPDMVDRLLKGPLGVKTHSPHQHLVGHTLAFNVPLMIAALTLLRINRDARLAGVAAASASHLLVDPVIRSPGTLFWPALGSHFPEARGLNRRITMLTQVAAATTIAAFGFALWRSGRLPSFISSGRL